MTTEEHTEKGIMEEDNPTINRLGLRRKEEHETQHGKKTMQSSTFKPQQAKYVKDINMKHNKDPTSQIREGH